MPSPSLVDMATRAACRNVDTIEDFADLPMQLIEPIIKRVTNPQQLRNIEVNCPHIADWDSDLWRLMIARDIPEYKDKLLEPKNPRLWWKVYRKLIRDEQRAKEASEESLRQSLQGLAQKRSDSQIQIIGRVLPHSRDPGQPKARVDSKQKLPALPSKAAKTGSDIMSTIRKQSAQAHRDKVWQPRRELLGIKGQLSNVPELPPPLPTKIPDLSDMRSTWDLGGNKTTVRKAHTSSVFSTPVSRNQKAINAIIQQENFAKEAKLRALTAPGATATIVTAADSSAARRPPTSVQKPRLQQTSPKPASTSPVPTKVDVAHTMSSTSPIALAASKSLDESQDMTSSGTTTVKKRPASGSIFMATKKRKP